LQKHHCKYGLKNHSTYTHSLMKFIAPSYKDIALAAERIAPYAHITPVLSSENLNKLLGTKIFFKCENFQKVGAFKFRGGCNSVFNISEEHLQKGVATHSSGNHAQAVALAAKLRTAKAYIVMPENAPKVKIEAVKGYGAEIIFCDSTISARESTLADVVKKTGATEIHPYDYFDVIAGQGTCAKEFLENNPELDIIMAPIGGGGLLSGTAIASKAIKPTIKVIGAEPDQADDAYQSFISGKRITDITPNTIADGLRTTVGKLTFSIIQDQVDQIVTVSEASIIEALKLIWTRLKIIIEPSCAVPVAALLEQKIDLSNKPIIGIILTGGNVDLDKLPW